MRVANILPVSTKDILGHAVAVIFTVGCNFRCSYCHNADLISPRAGREESISAIIQQLRSNPLISGVKITGGEPTLQQDLGELCACLSSEFEVVGLDTNGTHPEVIKRVLPHLSHLAVDFKAPLGQYGKIVNSPVDATRVAGCIQIGSEASNLEFEVRVTVARELLALQDLYEMSQYLEKINFPGILVLQQYQESAGVREEVRGKLHSYDEKTLLSMMQEIREEMGLRIALRSPESGLTLLE